MTYLGLMSENPRLLRPADMPGLIRLKDAAAWNQTAEDWQRVLAIEPEGCFGIDCDGTLAASATVVCYGADLAWIGMVLTLPEFRGRGLARKLMEHSIAYCERRGVGWAKLDATDMGAPLYAKLGFEPECAVERCLREPGPVSATGAIGQGEPDLRLDRRAFGADRGALLRELAAEGAAIIRGEAFAMGRPGSRAAFFGPCVSRSAESARRLLEWYLAAHPREPVFWDVLPENEASADLAKEFGFAPVRRLARMGRRIAPAAAPFECDNSLVFGIAGFEFG